MKIIANAVKLGNILLYKNNLWEVVKNPEHKKPGKGVAYIQMEMKNLKDSTKIYERFNSADYIEKVFLDQSEYQFLYEEDNKLFFMNTTSFEQISLDKSIIGDKILFLQENILVNIELYNNNPIRVLLPLTVTVEVIDTISDIKNSTITSLYKPAVVTGMIKVMVPSYIKIGEKILIKTEDKSFVEKAKS